LTSERENSTGQRCEQIKKWVILSKALHRVCRHCRHRLDHNQHLRQSWLVLILEARPSNLQSLTSKMKFYTNFMIVISLLRPLNDTKSTKFSDSTLLKRFSEHFLVLPPS